MSWWKSLAKVGLGLGGNALLPGLGGIAGAALGRTLFRSGAPGAPAAPAASPLAGADGLRSALTADATANPFQSSTYRNGIADIDRRNAMQAQTDTASAASRGMIGGEMEIAQAANRANTALAGQSALANQSLGAQQSARGGLLGLLQTEEQTRQAELQRRAQGRAATAGALGSVAAAGVPSLLGLLNGVQLRPPSGLGQG